MFQRISLLATISILSTPYALGQDSNQHAEWLALPPEPAPITIDELENGTYSKFEVRIEVRLKGQPGRNGRLWGGDSAVNGSSGRYYCSIAILARENGEPIQLHTDSWRGVRDCWYRPSEKIAKRADFCFLTATSVFGAEIHSASVRIQSDTLHPSKVILVHAGMDNADSTNEVTAEFACKLHDR